MSYDVFGFENRGWKMGTHPSVQESLNRFCDLTEQDKYGFNSSNSFELRFLTDVAYPRIRSRAPEPPLEKSILTFYNRGNDTPKDDAYKFLNNNVENGIAGMIVNDRGRNTAVILGIRDQPIHEGTPLKRAQAYYVHVCKYGDEPVKSPQTAPASNPHYSRSAYTQMGPEWQSVLLKTGIVTLTVAGILAAYVIYQHRRHA